MKYSKEWLTKKEIKKLFSLPEINSRDLLLMKVTYYGALRINEAIKSRREHYKKEPYPHLILYSQKTDKRNWEIQPIPSEVLGDIIRYCKSADIRTQDFVFQTNRSDQISYSAVYKLVKKWCRVAEIDKDITTHSFRRSRATHLLEAGVMDIYKVSQFLRHKNIKTTQAYLKISKKRMYLYMEDSDKNEMLNLI